LDGPLPVARRRAVDLANLCRAEADATVRVNLALELGRIRDVAGARQLVGLLETESDPDARLAILAALSNSPSRNEAAADIQPALEATYRATGSVVERVEIQNTLAATGTRAAADFLRAVYGDSKADPCERISAAEGLFDLDSRGAAGLTADEATAINTRLQLDAQAAGDPEERSLALMALGGRRSQNIGFFQQMLETETDPNVRRLLEKLSGEVLLASRP
jgi:hypothetical protein